MDHTKEGNKRECKKDNDRRLNRGKNRHRVLKDVKKVEEKKADKREKGTPDRDQAATLDKVLHKEVKQNELPNKTMLMDKDDDIEDENDNERINSIRTEENDAEIGASEEEDENNNQLWWKKQQEETRIYEDYDRNNTIEIIDGKESSIGEEKGEETKEKIVAN